MYSKGIFDAAGTLFTMVRALTWKNSMPRYSPVPMWRSPREEGGEQHPGLLILDETPAQLARFLPVVHGDSLSNIRT